MHVSSSIDNICVDWQQKRKTTQQVESRSLDRTTAAHMHLYILGSYPAGLAGGGWERPRLCGHWAKVRAEVPPRQWVIDPAHGHAANATRSIHFLNHLSIPGTESSQSSVPISIDQ